MEEPAVPSGTPANVDGQWEAQLEYVRGNSNHAFVFEQKGADLVGTHMGDILSGDLRGNVEGDTIRFRSSHRYEGTRVGYAFEGTVDGDRMQGTVDLDEYGKAQWTAQRHRYGRPGGLVRPVKNV
jgi:hypothetical protein